MTQNKNQHYTPQYYLKNFSEDEEIHIFDLKTRNKFKNSIRSTAYKKFFHNIDLDFFNNVIENEIITDKDYIDKTINEYNERILAPFFDSFNSTRQRILNDDRRETISIIDFNSLTEFILVQLYRNPKLSLFLKEIDKQVKLRKPDSKKEYDKIMRGIYLLILFNQLHSGKRTIFKEDFIGNFKNDIDYINQFKKLIEESLRIVYWNRTETDFLTSDFAISLTRLRDEDLFSTIFVPINTKIGVLYINRESPLLEITGQAQSTRVEIEKEDVETVHNLNLSTINNANRFVYSQNGYFHYAIENIEYKPWWNVE